MTYTIIDNLTSRRFNIQADDMEQAANIAAAKLGLAKCSPPSLIYKGPHVGIDRAELYSDHTHYHGWSEQPPKHAIDLVVIQQPY